MNNFQLMYLMVIINSTHVLKSSMPESHKLVYLTRMFPVFMELFTGTLPVNTESWTGIVPANNLFQIKSSGNIKLT